MDEQFANNAITTLALTCAPGDLTITVTNPSAFPSIPEFNIVVGSGDSGDAEVMAVTGVSGNVFTVTRASEPTAGVQTAFEHLSGSTVAQVITKAGLAALILNNVDGGTWP